MGRSALNPISKGDTFGKLTVTSDPFLVIAKNGVRKWWVAVHCAACGNPGQMRCNNIRNKPPQSCGCLSRKRFVESLTKHGASHTLLYGVWSGMKGRCYQPASKGYHNYGGRGIGVCEEWRSGFEPFQLWALANGYAEGLEIDRVDNDGNYEPRNCRWVTPIVNQRNRRVSRILEAFGEKKTLGEWAQDSRCRVRERTLSARKDYGWSDERAITTEVMFVRKPRAKSE